MFTSRQIRDKKLKSLTEIFFCMEAYEHFIISAAAGLLFTPLIIQDLSFISFTFFWICCIAAGTLIDLDHFLIAAIRDRNFNELKLAIFNPKKVLSDNNAALGNLIPNWSRYVSHFILLFLIPSGIYLINRELSLLIFIILGLHILSDIVRSVQEGQEFFDKPWQE